MMTGGDYVTVCHSKLQLENVRVTRISFRIGKSSKGG